MVSVTVKPRAGKQSKRFPLTVNLDGKQATVGALKRAIESQAKVR